MTVRNRTVVSSHRVCQCLGITALWLVASSSAVVAQTTTNIVQGADGVTYRETRQVVEKMIPTTSYQTRQEQVYQPQTSTTMQTYQQNYLTPVTEYRWVARRRGVLNPFVQPYWTNQLEPFTRWENRPATVQVPVAKTEWVSATRTVSTPVTSYKPVKEEHVSRVAIGVKPTTTPAQPGTAVASRPQLSPIGGQQLQSDPPRTATGWTSASGSTNRYR